jgi:integrase
VVVKQIADGDYSPDPQAGRFPKFREKSDEGLPLLSLYDQWADQKKPAVETVPAWRRNIEKFIISSKIQDARLIKRTHVIAWRNAMQTQGIGAIRIRDGYIASLKAVLSYGVDTELIEFNAAAGVKVIVPKMDRPREPDLNSEEVYKILRASLESDSGDGRHSDASIASRRWVPWLCAYTGARVSEMTGLQSSDVIREDGIFGIAIKKTKSGLARKVPLHSHVIEQGFLDFVARHGKGPLFLTAHKSKPGVFSSPKTRGEKLAKWVRGKGVIDENVSPNHGWRHRFKTEARLIQMRDDVVNFLQGHAPATEGHRYGHIPFAVTGPWIEMLPRYDVTGGELIIDRKRLPSEGELHRLQQMLEMLAAGKAGTERVA